MLFLAVLRPPWPRRNQGHEPGALSSRLHIPPLMSTWGPTLAPSPPNPPSGFPLQCSPRKPPPRRGWGRSPGPLEGSEAREGRGGPGPGCGLLLARGTASPGLRRWLGSPRLLRAGRPPGQRVGGPPGAPPAGLGPLRGRQARDWRVLLSEQTVHLGCRRCGVTAPGAPQPIRVPASQLVSSHRVPLSMAHAHEDSQSEGQEAPAAVLPGAPGAAVGGRGPHGAGGDWRALSGGKCPGGLRWPRSAPRPAARFSRSRGSKPAFPGRGLGGVSGPGAARPEPGVRSSPAGRAPPPHLRAFSRLCSLLKGRRTLLFLETSPCFFVSFIYTMPPPRRDSSAPSLRERERGIPATPTLAPGSERAAKGG